MLVLWGKNAKLNHFKYINQFFGQIKFHCQGVGSEICRAVRGTRYLASIPFANNTLRVFKTLKV
jgi:hypothetical protein